MCLYVGPVELVSYVISSVLLQFSPVKFDDLHTLERDI